MIHENDDFEYGEAEEVSFSDYIKDIKTKIPHWVKQGIAGDMAIHLDRIKSICYGKLDRDGYDCLLEQIKLISDIIDNL